MAAGFGWQLYDNKNGDATRVGSLRCFAVCLFVLVIINRSVFMVRMSVYSKTISEELFIAGFKTRLWKYLPDPEHGVRRVYYTIPGTVHGTAHGVCQFTVSPPDS